MKPAEEKAREFMRSTGMDIEVPITVAEAITEQLKELIEERDEQIRQETLEAVKGCEEYFGTARAILKVDAIQAINNTKTA